MRKIAVIGLGYVGLPLAVLLSRSCSVVGVDVNERRVSELNRGVCFIDEADFRQEFKSSHVNRNFVAKNSPEAADAFIIAVPTPVTKEKKPDLSYVYSALESIVPLLKKGNLVIIESTVPPLTAAAAEKAIEAKTGLKVPEDVLLAHCPERVLPGSTLRELTNNSRIIGGIDSASAEAAAEIYASFTKGEIVKTDATTAEFCKLIENSFRDVNIAFANELGLMAEKLGIGVKEAISIANRHPRVSIHSPGIGVGGHCIPIDPWFLVEADKNHTTLIQAARRVNDSMPEVTAEKIISAVKKVKSPKIVTIGLSYKPDVGDLRESPAIEVVRLLKGKGFGVTDYDPVVEGKKYDSLAAAAKGADCLAILVEHSCVLKELASKEAEIKAEMRTPMLLRFP